MTEENNLIETELNKDNTVKIYSKRAIYGFSFAFTTIFGGVLLRQNLIDTKRKKEANIVLAFSIIYTVLTMIIVSTVDLKTNSLTFLLNLVGGVILSEYFYKKYFPDSRYEHKKVWKALLISIIIMIPFLLVAIYTMSE